MSNFQEVAQKKRQDNIESKKLKEMNRDSKKEREAYKFLSKMPTFVAKSVGYAYNKYQSGGYSEVYVAGFHQHEELLFNVLKGFLEYAGVPFRDEKNYIYKTEHENMTGVNTSYSVSYAILVDCSKKLKSVSDEEKSKIVARYKFLNKFFKSDFRKFSKTIVRAIKSGKTTTYPSKGVYKGEIAPTTDAMQSYNEILIGDITKMWFAKLILGIVIVVFLYNYFF